MVNVVYQNQYYTFAAVVPAVLDSGIVNSLATFQAPTGALTADGSPDGTYADVAGFVGIRCMDAPTSNLRITADERKTDMQIESDNSDHVWLAGFYPEIESYTEWRAVITDAAGNIRIFNVLGAECDSQAQTTRVKVQVATV